MSIKAVNAVAKLEEIEKVLASEIPELELAAVGEPNTELERRLVSSLRKVRSALKDLKRKLKSDEKSLTVDQLCSIINENLKNRSVREACNVAQSLYGPGFMEGLTPLERVRTCETILQFFEDANTVPPLSYWRMVLESQGSFDY